MRGRGRGPIGGRGDGGRGRFGGGRGRGRGKFGKEGGHAESHKDGGDSVRRVGRTKVWRTSEDALHASFRYQIFTEGEPRLGWLLNMVSSAMDDPNNDNTTYSCVNLYFMCQDGSTFKAQVRFAPYFYLGTKENTELEVDSSLRRRYGGQIANIEIVNKEDLDLAVEVDVGLDMVVSGMEVVDMEGDKDKEREEKILFWHALEKSNWSLRKAMAVGL